MVLRQGLLITISMTLLVILLALAVEVAVHMPPWLPTENGDRYNGLTRRMSNDNTPLLGDPEAAITVVEFADFACASCVEYQAVIQDFIQRYVRTGKARLEFRILAGLDPAGSALAARAALCAGEQNAFWEIKDELMGLQRAYGRTAFTEDRIRAAAARLQLDPDQWAACVSDEDRYQEALQSNVDLALSLNVNRLPAILIRQGSGHPMWLEVNDQRITGGVPLGVLSTFIDTSLASNTNRQWTSP